eukprot:gnl/MRDRNA2_/MRDRNA2_176760_c0_seq1.p1 gnl/MRDRNA2_/MRDRNA2_176760_c0~~gnl/MRDRNA2_/MRDRNA2_176760_c0_seq1.p1  ORF type:complete len:100 (+),score=14.84 gnl/MRDRNA2_/MRDRNA2_176760_c0_seq1:76-375(+)
MHSCLKEGNKKRKSTVLLQRPRKRNLKIFLLSEAWHTLENSSMDGDLSPCAYKTDPLFCIFTLSMILSNTSSVRFVFMEQRYRIAEWVKLLFLFCVDIV